MFFEFRCGTRCPNAKLTDQQAREIFARYNALPTDPAWRRKGVSELAKQFGVSGANVAKIGRRRAWRHATETQ